MINSALEELRSTCRTLLAEGQVQAVIGYGQPLTPLEPARPVPIIITQPEDCDRLLWDDQCLTNLTAYLKKKEVRALGKVALVVKGCDARTLVVLEKESQIDRAQIVAVGMACEGVGHPRAAKCSACDAHMPAGVDVTIGQAVERDEPRADRYRRLEELMQMPVAERMRYWREELDRCVKCYACRQSCPLCYCERCVVDKNRPQVISTSATPKGNFAWHVTRAFHLAGRCIGCGECVRACPVGIDLELLNLSLAKAAEENFDYRAGVDAAAEPIVGGYSTQDREAFIR